MITDIERREALKAVANDCAETLCRQIDAATNLQSLEEISARMGRISEFLTPRLWETA